MRSQLSAGDGRRLSRRARRARSDEDSNRPQRAVHRERCGAAARLGAVEDRERPWILQPLLRRRVRRSGRIHRHHARARQGADSRPAPRRHRRPHQRDRAARDPHGERRRLRQAGARSVMDAARSRSVAQHASAADRARRSLLHRHAAQRSEGRLLLLPQGVQPDRTRQADDQHAAVELRPLRHPELRHDGVRSAVPDRLPRIRDGHS